MPTTEQDKPAAKPRQRSRKTDNKADQRNQKVEQTVEAKPDFEPTGSSPDMSPAEVAPIEDTPVEATPVEVAPVALVAEMPDMALSGEVLPPEVRGVAPQAAALQAIASSQADYTRKSWQAGRFLVERMIAARSFDEAIEIQGEFAKQAYVNFVAHSQKICVLYGEWTQQLLRPFDKFAAQSTRIGR